MRLCVRTVASQKVETIPISESRGQGLRTFGVGEIPTILDPLELATKLF